MQGEGGWGVAVRECVRAVEPDVPKGERTLLGDPVVVICAPGVICPQVIWCLQPGAADVSANGVRGTPNWRTLSASERGLERPVSVRLR